MIIYNSKDSLIKCINTFILPNDYMCNVRTNIKRNMKQTQMPTFPYCILHVNK